MRRPLFALLLAAVLVPAAPAAAQVGGLLPRFGDITVGLAAGGSSRPVEPGDEDVLLSPMLSGELGFQLPALFSVGAHVRAEAAGPAVGWDLAFAGVVGGGTSLHGDGRTSADLFLGLPIPVRAGWYVQPFFRGGPFLDAPEEGYGVFGIAVKWSSFLDRASRTAPSARPPPAIAPSRPPRPAPHPHPSPPHPSPRPGRRPYPRR
jgi:hypothetical protein